MVPEPGRAKATNVNTQGTNQIIWHHGHVARSDRNVLNNHKSGLIWFTGLSASGKSTIAHGVEKILFERSLRAYVLDGDNIRHGLNANLGFSPEDRQENLRRVAEVAKLFADAGILVLAAFISPSKKDRQYIRQHFENDNFIEIYVKCCLEECERRDPKGLYKKARAGIIKNYTGISAPYEEPVNPELIIETARCTPDSSIAQVISYLEKRQFIQTLRS